MYNKNSLVYEFKFNTISEPKSITVFKPEIRLIQQLIFSLQHPLQQTDDLIGLFLQELGYIAYAHRPHKEPSSATLQQSDPFFLNAVHQLTFIKNLLPIFARRKPTTGASYHYLLSAINLMHYKQQTFRLSQDLAKSVLLVRYCNPDDERAQDTLNLMHWRYKLFHGIEL